MEDSTKLAVRRRLRGHRSRSSPAFALPKRNQRTAAVQHTHHIPGLCRFSNPKLIVPRHSIRIGPGGKGAGYKSKRLHRPPQRPIRGTRLKSSLAKRRHIGAAIEVQMKVRGPILLRPGSPPAADFQSLPVVPTASRHRHDIRRSESRRICP